MPMKKVVVTIVFFLILIITIVVMIFGPRGLIHLRGLQKELADLTHHNSELQKENEVLRSEVELLKHNLLYIEELARKELGLMKEDELLYHLKEEKKQK